MTALHLKYNRNILFIGIIAIAIFAGGSLMLHLAPLPIRGKIANGLLADFMLTFPIAYYLVVVRPLKKPVKSLLLVFTICCALAYLILPQQQRGYILQIRKVSYVAELAFVIYAVSRFNKIRAVYKTEQAHFADPVYNLRHAMTVVLGNSLPIKMLASEVAMLRYGIFFLKKEKPQQTGAVQFTTHQDSGYIGIWSVLFSVTLTETVAFHLLINKYSHIAAIIVTLLTVYGMVLFVADLSAMFKRKVIINAQQLVLRTGLRWRAVTSLDNIDSLQKITGDYQSDAGHLKGGFTKSSGNVIINFKIPVLVQKFYGKDKEVTSILMNIDEVDTFINSCAAKNL